MVSQVEQSIIDCLNENKSFLLDAGAGSGKTWTLIQALKYIIANKSKFKISHTRKVACITYTNVAKDEIIERIEHNENVVVCTIHDFLWDCISKFSYEIQDELVVYLKGVLVDTKAEMDSKTRKDSKLYRTLEEKLDRYIEDISELETVQKSIEYMQSPKYKKGFISHDDVIRLSVRLFEKHPRLKKLVVDCYPIVFVDEYQDTQKETIEILMNYLQTSGNIIIGFFGDKMQQIYDTGVGEILHNGALRTIQKTENYRCSKKVISLLNKIRTDLVQIPGNDEQPEGDCRCFITNPEADIDLFIETQLLNDWKLGSISEVKKLFLTHRLIFIANGSEALYQIVANRNDVFTDNKNNRTSNPWIDVLHDTCNLISLYESNRIQEFIKYVHYEIESFEKKKKLKELMDQLVILKSTSTIKIILEYVFNNEILKKSNEIQEYDFDDSGKLESYNSLIDLPFNMYVTMYKVYEEDTPFTTKHGTKGTEFDNVLVIVDDVWFKYNFNEYLSNDNKSNPNRFNITQHLFYVVCSRAKMNLAVLCKSNVSEVAKANLEKWFGNLETYSK